MVNRKKKDRQYNDQQKKEGQTIQWSTEKRTDNTMVKRKKKDRQYNDQKKKGQTIQWSTKHYTEN